LRGAAESVEFFIALPRPKTIGCQFDLEDVDISIGVRSAIIPRIESPVAASDPEILGFLV
jgi:hypothetical protein